LGFQYLNTSPLRDSTETGEVEAFAEKLGFWVRKLEGRIFGRDFSIQGFSGGKPSAKM
jgi:hypothetical protein